MSPPPGPPEAFARPARLPTVGEQFDKYSLLAKLATGGMAELFVARLSGAAGFSKSVVIKRILPHVAHDAHFARMFLDEAMTCAQLSHPNICQVFELCEAQGSHFLVLEHLEGATVGDLIRRAQVSQKQINLRLASGIIVQACDGLHAAHEQRDDEGQSIGLVHRDVSPGNLFVTVDGIVKVLDFGIAKAAWMSRKTRTGTLLGKCEYMSPEQARGGAPVDRRSDIFSLGIATWELVCGRKLFRRESEYETLKAVLRAPIGRPVDVRAGIPEALDHVIMRALERDPDDRFATAYEFRQAIAESLKEYGGPTPMCDIAPLIRSSFADELREQRALLRHANRLRLEEQAPKLRSLPILSDRALANTSEVTGQHRPQSLDLPSLERARDEEASMELTFRIVPKRVPTCRGEIDARPAATPPASDSLPSVLEPEKDTQALATQTDQATIDLAPTDLGQRAAAATPMATAVLCDPDSAILQTRRRSWMLLVPTALLCGALAATATLLVLRDGSETTAPQSAKLVESTTGKSTTGKSTTKSAARAAVPPPLGSADQNAQARADLLAANQQQAVVTQLDRRGDAAAESGTLTIRSSEPGQVFLYPDKELIGSTPLEDFRLPPGDYKLKVQVGPGKDEKKYFNVSIRAGENSSRNLNSWH